jgi:hypothetical protein
MASDTPDTGAGEPETGVEPELGFEPAEPAEPAPDPSPVQPEPVAQTERGGMLPSRGERPYVERLLMRLIATIGIVAIGVAIAAIMNSQHSKGWLIGLVVGIESVVLAAILWSSRRM